MEAMGQTTQSAPQSQAADQNINITPEKAREVFLNSEDGKRYLQSLTDKVKADTDKSLREQVLPSLVEQRYNELHPAETEAEKQLREVNQKIEKIERESQRKELKLEANKIASEMNIPLDIVDDLIGNDVETTRARIQKFNDYTESLVNKRVEERLGKIGQSTPTNNGDMPKQNLDLHQQKIEAEKRGDFREAMRLNGLIYAQNLRK